MELVIVIDPADGVVRTTDSDYLRKAGVDVDFRDFPFVEWFGFSSYPYLAGFTEPAQVPSDWYSRLLGNRTLPTLITEGGWTTGRFGAIQGSAQRQADWIRRHAVLLDALKPRYYFQLTFSDLTNRVFGTDPRLEPFLRLGLVDTALTAKPSLAVWDSLYARRNVRP